MAQFNFTIPDAQVNRVVDALAVLTGWTATIRDPQNPGQMITNPVTKNQNAKNTISGFIKDSVKEVEMQDHSTAFAFIDPGITTN